MKKITYFLGIIATFAICIGSLFMVHNWPYHDIILQLGFPLLFFFIMLFFIIKIQEKQGGIFLNVLYLITAELLSIGVFYKLMHWPSAGTLYFLGFLFFNLLFIPVFFINKIKTDKPGRSIYIYGLILGFFFILGTIFKIQHWPLAGMLLTLSTTVAVMGIIPCTLIYYNRKKEASIIDFGIILFIVFAICLYTFSSTKLSAEILTNFKESNKTNELTIACFEGKIKRQTQLNDSLIHNDNTAMEISKITEESDKSFNYIQDLKDHLVSISGGKMSDGSPKRYTDKDIPTRVMIKEGKGTELKSVIESYRESMLQIVKDNDEKMVKFISECFTLESRSNQSWEKGSFDKIPIINTINILSELQANIRITEYRIINLVIEETHNVNSK